MTCVCVCAPRVICVPPTSASRLSRAQVVEIDIDAIEPRYVPSPPPEAEPVFNTVEVITIVSDGVKVVAPSSEAQLVYSVLFRGPVSVPIEEEIPVPSAGSGNVIPPELQASADVSFGGSGAEAVPEAQSVVQSSSDVYPAPVVALNAAIVDATPADEPAIVEGASEGGSVLEPVGVDGSIPVESTAAEDEDELVVSPPRSSVQPIPVDSSKLSVVHHPRPLPSEPSEGDGPVFSLNSWLSAPAASPAKPNANPFEEVLHFL